MKLEQSFEVDAPLERVWQTLIDVEHVAPCLPGASVTGRNEDGSYNGTFTVKIGPTTASYSGKLEMETIDEASHSATMQAQGTDKRGQGGAKATIFSRLEPADGRGTRVEVVTDYHITGRLARFGRGGMIEDISERLLREFAKRLQSSLSAQRETVVSRSRPSWPRAGGGRPSEPVGALTLGRRLPRPRRRRARPRLSEPEAAAPVEPGRPRARARARAGARPDGVRPGADRERAGARAPPAVWPPPPTVRSRRRAAAAPGRGAPEPMAVPEPADPASGPPPAEPAAAAAAGRRAGRRWPRTPEPPGPPPPPAAPARRRVATAARPSAPAPRPAERRRSRTHPPSEPIQGLTLVGGVLWSRVKRNPAPAAAAGVAVVLLLARRRRRRH